jgi:riboflavin kinase/FMN adenylyltransferase
VADAARLLGRFHRVEAQVVRGHGIGRTLGFPTANLELLEHQALPADGIYAVWVTTPDGKRRVGALSIGVRPTIGDGEHVVEVYVLDFDGDLVSRPLAVEFVSWLREEKRFPDLDALREAIGEDVRRIRELMKSKGNLPETPPAAGKGADKPQNSRRN